MNKAVHKLNVAIGHYTSAQKAEKNEVGALAKAKTSEQNTLKSIANQRQAILDQFQDPTTTLDPATQAKLLSQDFALGEKQIQTTDAFAKTSAHDKGVISKDKKTVSKDRTVALKDLKPAEYHLSLKATNKDRKELGLHALKHTVRAPAPKASKTVADAQKYLGKFESQLQAEGVTEAGVPTNESCANFVSSMLKKSGMINFHTNLVSDLNTELRDRGWKPVSLANAKPGDVWICNGAHGESHTEIVASNHNGHVTLIGSNNHPVDSNQQINYDGSSASLSGSFILSPP